MKKKENRSNESLKLINVLIFSLVVTTAKGLRFSGNLGPGELISLAISLWLIIRYNGKIGTNISKVTFFFWNSIILALMLGMFVRLNFHNLPNPFPRTLFAYIFCFVISYGVLSSELLTKNIKHTSLAYIRITSLVLIAFSIMIFLNVRSLFGIKLYWLGTSRFQGWSLDPNQVAIPFIITPFLLLNRLKTSNDSKIKKISLILLICVNIYVGMATDSDSLIAAWVISLVIILCFLVIIQINDRRKINSKVVFLLITLSVVFLFTLPIDLQNLKIFIEDFLTKDSQLSTRIRIWSTSIDIIKKSPLVGLGPDIGRNIGSSILGESHNNILHLGMSTGLVGICLLLYYYSYILINILKSKNIYLLGAFTALFIFGLTHYTLRHPLYWFMILLIDGMAKNEIRRRIYE